MAQARLEQLGQGIWLADGPVVDFYGFPYSTRMALVRLRDGGLWVWSPIALDDGLRAAVDALGEVRHLVSPNKIHHLFLGEWHEAYPQAKLWGPPSTIAKRADLPFTGPLGDGSPPEWAGQIDQYLFDNSRFLEEVAFVHRASRTAIFADLSENFSAAFIAGHWSWWQRPIARLWKIVEGWGYAPLELRATFRRRAAARRKIAAIIAAGVTNVVMAHGEVARGNGTAYLRQCFAWLDVARNGAGSGD